MHKSSDSPPPSFVTKLVNDGTFVLLASPLNRSLVSALLQIRPHITELSIIWRGDAGDTRLLDDFVGLRRLKVTNRTQCALPPLSRLINLRVLEVISDTRFDADLRRWPLLESLSLTWNGKLESLGCTKLRSLYVTPWRQPDLAPLGNLPHLRNLEITGGSLRSLSGVEACKRLENLTIAYLTKLEDFSAIRSVPSLKTVTIDSCKRLHSLSCLAPLPNLEKLDLNNVGNIESLEPLRANDKLTALYFAQSTNVLDGNTKVIVHMGIDKFAFQNRRHYNFTYNHLLLRTPDGP